MDTVMSVTQDLVVPVFDRKFDPPRIVVVRDNAGEKRIVMISGRVTLVGGVLILEGDDNRVFCAFLGGGSFEIR
jgi:hypothetical protein